MLLKSVQMIPMLARVCDDADLNVAGFDAQRIWRAWEAIGLVRSGGSVVQS